MIKVFGDSHTLMLEEYGIHCGALTACRLPENHKIVIEHFKKEGIIKEKNVLGALFGEIDCRIHIYHQCYKHQISIKQIIVNTIDTYIIYLNALYQLGYNVHFIVAIVPASQQGNAYNYEHYASYALRQVITINFNRYLKFKAYESGYHFIDYYPYILKKNYEVKDEFRLPDLVHLTTKIKPIIISLIQNILYSNHPNCQRRND